VIDKRLSTPACRVGLGNVQRADNEAYKKERETRLSFKRVTASFTGTFSDPASSSSSRTKKRKEDRIER